MRRLALLALILAPSIPRPTGACSALPDNAGEHAVDTAFATDLVPPSVVTVAMAVDRNPGSGSGGCGGAACSDRSNVVFLSVDATDDRAPSSQLGYQLTVVAGQVPSGMTIPTTAVGAIDGDLRLWFPSDTRAIAFDLEIRAVDLNGNLGPATVITISDPG